MEAQHSSVPTQPCPFPVLRERMLTYRQVSGRWTGEDSRMRLWMDNATFWEYVRVYCEGSYGSTPTP
jgi:hypothetical protein